MPHYSSNFDFGNPFEINPSMVSKGVLILAFFILAKPLLCCPKDEKCLDCINGYCTSCVFSFPDTNGNCVNTTSVDNCLIYRDENTCMSCLTGFFFDEKNNKCIAFPSKMHCLHSWKNLTFCEVCSGGTYFNPQTGSCLFSNDTCSIKNCDSCYRYPSGREVCIYCKENYTLFGTSYGNSSECVPSEMEGCAWTQRIDSCDICKPGYYDNVDRCVKLISKNDTNESADSFLTSLKTTLTAMLGLLFLL